MNGRPYSRRVGWVVRSSEHHRRRLEASKDPWIRFYLNHNPVFQDGDGMLMIVPFNLQNGWHGAWNLVRRRLRGAVRRVAAFVRPLDRMRAALGER